ncbi:MAG: TonB-dependent receptor [Syntrophaceae bacterium]|nr:TonB-dependent receptor [Syntrophaceae bacterium]
MRRTIISIASIFMAFLLIGSMGYTQTRTGSIRGTVTDTEGEFLPGATVELSGEKLMGGGRSIITNEEGKFRFPNLLPGVYEVTVSMEGFQTAKRTGLKVNIGGTTTVDVVLNLASLEETITVSAETPLVDVQKSVVSTNIGSELMEVLPMRRFTFFDFVGTTPGVTSSTGDHSNNWQSAMGSGTTQNAYYFEGVETNSPDNAGAWLWANPDQIEEIDVIVSGAPAEYGNFQGMVVNLVSKTGSNSFRGNLNFYYRANWLTGNNTPNEEFPFYRDKYNELTGTIGGPIIRDKLWFFWAGQLMTDTSVGVGADPAFGAGLYRYNTTFGRLDWQINKNNKLTLSCDINWYRWEETPDAFSPYETSTSEDSWNPLPSATWTSILSQNTFFEIKYTGWWCNQIAEAADGDRVTSAHYDAATGMYSGNSYYWGEWPQGQHQIQGTVSHFADDFLLGDHEFKFGVLYNHSWAGWKWGYNGNMYYYDWDSYPYYAFFMDPEEYGGVLNRISAFFDDSWTIHDRLTLNLGIRFDHTRGGYPEFARLDKNANPTGETFPADMDILRWDVFSPRLGLVYQLTDDRKTVVKASYGRYYGHMLMRDFYQSAPSKSDRYWYGYNWDTGEFDYLWQHIDPIADRGIDRNIRNPYSDQFSIAIEREILPGFSLSLTGIYKESRDPIDDQNTTAEYEVIDYYDEFGDQTIQIYNQTNDSFYLTTNRGDKATYKALILAFKKRLSNNWQVNGSFTWSKALDYPVGYWDRNDLINRYGVPGSYDREYSLKLSGTYIFPYGFMLSAFFAYEQGRPFNREIPIWLNQGRVWVAAEERGSKRYPSPTYLDLRLEKEFRIWGNSRIKLLIDIWNVFNADYNNYVASTNAASSAYLAPTGYVLPRRAQLGLRFVF